MEIYDMDHMDKVAKTIGEAMVKSGTISISGRYYPPPATHAGDPDTAHEAEQAVTASGKRQTQVEWVLKCVQVAPGSTAYEIGIISRLGHIPAQRRLSDLKTLGKVYMDGTKTVNGRKMRQWWPVEEQLRLC